MSVTKIMQLGMTPAHLYCRRSRLGPAGMGRTVRLMSYDRIDKNRKSKVSYGKRI